ncbi:hypothetical protein ABZ023_16330 [Streptomyces sp. NPDC006367]|uniref:hypothetical protein n=1 Tax=unclassified Streptomyces TaxID=2593676 RepID=UPI00339E94A3
MTQTPVPSPSSTPAAAADGPTRTRRLLRAVAVVSCLPYLGLKAAWIAGSRAGIPEGSTLLDHRTTMAVANGVSLLMDSCVIVLALVLTRPWGRRVPAPALALPVWVATGLLAPIMTGFPLQLLTRALTGDTAGESGGAGREPFLDEWVFGVVYTGFIVQGLALGALFVLYARDRWGHLWRGRMWDLPSRVTDRTQQAVAVTAGALALFPAAVRLYWACGGTAGLGADRAAERTGDFHVLEGMYAAFLAGAVAGALLLAFRRAPALRVRVPLALTWVCSGAAACWGGWMLLGSLATAGGSADDTTPLTLFTYAAQMLVGLLLATVGARFLTLRTATSRVRP